MTDRRLTDAQVDELAEHLTGTAGSVDEALELLFGLAHDDLDAADAEALDEHVFLCDECGWWCELCEMADGEDHVCEDCRGA